MTLNKLASLIAKREGKKHQASIGDVREILGVIADLLWAEMNGPGKDAFKIFKALEGAACRRNKPKKKRGKR